MIAFSSFLTSGERVANIFKDTRVTQQKQFEDKLNVSKIAKIYIYIFTTINSTIPLPRSTPQSNANNSSSPYLLNFWRSIPSRQWSQSFCWYLNFLEGAANQIALFSRVILKIAGKLLILLQNQERKKLKCQERRANVKQ